MTRSSSRALCTVAALVALSACTGSHGQSRPTLQKLGTVSGTLLADHSRGVVSGGRGPVSGILTVRTPKGALVKTAPTRARGLSLSLPRGRYVLSATIADGGCQSADVRIEDDRSRSLTLRCIDGFSTD